MITQAAIEYLYSRNVKSFEDLSLHDKRHLLYLLAPGKPFLDLIDETQYLLEDVKEKDYPALQYLIANHLPDTEYKINTLVFPDVEEILDYLEGEKKRGSE